MIEQEENNESEADLRMRVQSLEHEIAIYKNEAASIKASHFYKASSLEKQLQEQVEKKNQLKAKVKKIRAVLITLNEMITSPEDRIDNKQDESNLLDQLCTGISTLLLHAHSNDNKINRLI